MQMGLRFDMVIVLCRDFVTMPRRPLMVRAALLQRSCDGVAAATELRRPAPSRSFCASRLPSRRDALNEEPAFISPRVDLNFNGRGPQS